eukprot:scaffold14206_cov41-Phaeocystis_antarctica.AAC.2
MRVASHALNLTGASLHPARRPAFWELRRQLTHVLTQRRRGGRQAERKQRRAGPHAAKGGKRKEKERQAAEAREERG